MYISACAYVLKVRGKVKREKMGARAYGHDHCVMCLLKHKFKHYNNNTAAPYHCSTIALQHYRVSQKKLTFVWGAVAPLKFELRKKVRGVLESTGFQL